MANRIDPSYLAEVQKNTSKIRNFCILAHVDHGKTTLSDSLVSSNGIISAKLAGKLRYMDSTEEEQKRGITMHSSAISLLFDMEDRKKATKDDTDDLKVQKDEYLINLVDSPGHIDFSSDVSTATRLCDGALIVIDVLEGICTQTHAVLYKALKERMRPCLVLNKIDRLLIDMRLSTVEAFQHLRRLVENVNALAFTLLNSEILKRTQEMEANLGVNSSATVPLQGAAAGDEEEDDPLVTEWTFSPEKGNVVFAGALDCWGFGILKFANLWAKELGVNKNVLRKYLFEDYSFNPVTKKIARCDPNDPAASRPMFASMVLDPIWKIYELAVTNQEPEKAAKMANKRFGIELPPREINPRDPRATVQSIFRRWLPLSDAILRMVVRSMPSPVEAQSNRLFTLLPGVSEVAFNSSNSSSGNSETISMTSLSLHDATPECTDDAVTRSIEKVRDSVARCSTEDDAPLVVFISKMMPVRVAELSPRDIVMLNQRLAERAAEKGADESTDTVENSGASVLKQDGEIFMALARVYSGTIRRDSDIYVLGHRHDPLVGDDRGDADIHGAIPKSMQSVVTKVPKGSIGMYIMLGPSVFPTEEVSAGNIVGIVGLEESVLKTATLCDTWAAHPMKAITFQAKPMVQVAVEPLSYTDLKKLALGLQQLYQFDPVVEVGVDDSGQHTMMCLGELHLEQCVKALTERFAKCEVKVSEPLIAFRETVLPCESADYQSTLPPPWGDVAGLANCVGGVARLAMGTDNLAITFRCFSLPLALAALMEADGLTTTHADAYLSEYQRGLQHSTTVPVMTKEVSAFWSAAVSSLEACAQDNVPVDAGLYVSSELTTADQKELAVQRLVSRLLSVGPVKNGTNLLLLSPSLSVDVYSGKVPAKSGVAGTKSSAMKGTVEGEEEVGQVAASISSVTQSKLFHRIWSRLSSSVVAGFQVTTAAGPLMHEPLHAVGFSIESIEINKSVCAASLSASEFNDLFPSTACNDEAASTTNSGDLSADSTAGSSVILTGQLISEAKEAMHLSMLASPMRVVEPIYQCDLQCDQLQLGNLYAVLARRRGVVTKEDIIEGTSLFLLSANLPVANSFGFAQELLKKTSGAGTAPQLSFSHWQVNAIDPFWRPKTEEELEEYGEVSAVAEHNLPRTFIDKVRKRKGLAIEEKIVAFAEKQRTLNKKK